MDVQGKEQELAQGNGQENQKNQETTEDYVPRSELNKVIHESKKRKEKIREYEELLKKYPPLEEIEELRNLKKLKEKELEHKINVEDKYKSELEKIHKTYKEQINNYEQTIQNLQSTLAQNLIKNEIIATASSMGAYSPEQIAMLLSHEFKIIQDKKGNYRAIVPDEDGEPKIDLKTGKEITVADRVREFLQDEKNAHHIRANNRQGSDTKINNNIKRTKLEILQEEARKAKEAGNIRRAIDLGLQIDSLAGKI